MAAIVTGEAAPEAANGFRGLLDAVQWFDKPLLAAVNGVGVGLGFTLLPTATSCSWPTTPGSGSPSPRLGVPPEAASSYLFPGRWGGNAPPGCCWPRSGSTADQAVAAGLALRVCDEGTVVEETLALARAIASFPPEGTRQIKRLMMTARRPLVEAARAREEAAFAALFADPDTNPGDRLAAGLDR